MATPRKKRFVWIVALLIVICVLVFTRCSSTMLTVDSYDGRTGVATHKVYTKYYDAGTWLVPKRAGLVAIVDHEKSRNPFVYGVRKEMGALGPEDEYATGKVSISIRNFSDQALDVKILRIICSKGTIALENGVIHAVPNTTTEAVAGRVKILDSGTSIPMTIEYEVYGERSKLDLVLPRRTEEEIAKYFDPNGVPPYPWNGGGSKAD